jgi:hypothetical protein
VSIAFDLPELRLLGPTIYEKAANDKSEWNPSRSSALSSAVGKGFFGGVAGADLGGLGVTSTSARR